MGTTVMMYLVGDWIRVSGTARRSSHSNSTEVSCSKLGPRPGPRPQPPNDDADDAAVPVGGGTRQRATGMAATTTT